VWHGSSLAAAVCCTVWFGAYFHARRESPSTKELKVPLASAICANTPDFGWAFLTFVPSMSWQSVVFHTQKMKTKEVCSDDLSHLLVEDDAFFHGDITIVVHIAELERLQKDLLQPNLEILLAPSQLFHLFNHPPHGRTHRFVVLYRLQTVGGRSNRHAAYLI